MIENFTQKNMGSAVEYRMFSVTVELFESLKGGTSHFVKVSATVTVYAATTIPLGI